MHMHADCTTRVEQRQAAMGGFPQIPLDGSQQDYGNWQIRAAVLYSLFLQMILIFVGPIRKSSTSFVPRFLVLSCYLLADWVADLALGLLLNNLLPPQSCPIIFAFWAPFLLLHLGSPDTITAYCLDDNEHWRRHLIRLLFELGSASVIFYYSLKAGNPMIPATVLMFVVGIIKYGERTYSLYSGSVDVFRKKILDPPDPGPNYAMLMTEFDAKEKAGLDVEIVFADEEAKRVLTDLEEGETVRLVERSTSVETRAYDFFRIFGRLFINLILSYKERKISQAYFLEREDVTNSPAKAFEVIEVELNFLYDMVYTKASVAHSKAGCVLRFLASACLVSSLLIFFFHRDKGGFTRVDIAITYTLLLGGIGLDATALAMLLSSHRALIFLDKTRRLAWLARAVRSVQLRRWSKMLIFLENTRWLAWLARAVRSVWLRRWSEKTSQLNLVSYSLLKPDNFGSGLSRCLGGPRTVRALARVAEMLWVRETFDDFIFIRREWLRSTQGQGQEKSVLLDFVFHGLRERALAVKAKKSMGYEDMNEACSCRGERVLKDLHKQINESLREAARKEEKEEAIENKVSEKLAVITGSVEKEFDESLLLWHIATDLCCHPFRDTVPTKMASDMRPIGETLSEYMLYLLVKQPEMLSATAGIGLLRYRDTCAEAKRFFESAAAWDPDHGDARRMLLSVNTTKEPSKVKGDQCKSVLFDGVILGKALRDLGEELMWEVVAKVWVEMLTYAAGKCRGSTHVQQLSCGGELITIVWFLLAHMGLGDMYRIQEGDAKAKLIVRDQ